MTEKPELNRDKVNNVGIEKSSRRMRKLILVGPWRNREEFVTVYNWLYAENANDETKEQACKRLTIWAMRRGPLTPAAIVCTLILIKIRLKDNQQSTNNLTSEDLRVIYSSSLTRFLNHMSSICRTENIKSMYRIANELDLESFVVDLRHICAHGLALPDIDIFRRTTDYCLKWLKEYYWDNEIKFMNNTNVKDIRRLGHNEFDEKIEYLFTVYDAISEAMIRNCSMVQQGKKCLSAVTYINLKRFSNERKNQKDLKKLLRICVKKLSLLVKQQDILKGGSDVYLEAIVNMNFFFESAAYRTRTHDELIKMIRTHQSLFQMLAKNGFIESLFNRLIVIAENEYETIVKRKGASFWAHHIVKGFRAFSKFKYYCNPKKNNKTNEINKLDTSKKILKIYKNLKVNTKTTLIFGDSVQNPWSLYFKRDYIERRIMKINEFTLHVIKDCLELVIPSLEENEKTTLKKLMAAYVGTDCDDDDGHDNHNNDSIDSENNADPKSEKNKKQLINGSGKVDIYTLSHVLGFDADDEEMSDTSNDENVQGIWTRVPDNQDWSRCPIGRCVWE